MYLEVAQQAVGRGRGARAVHALLARARADVILLLGRRRLELFKVDARQ